jgi:macrolide-specific efflux system membrane fusion protein
MPDAMGGETRDTRSARGAAGRWRRSGPLVAAGVVALLGAGPGCGRDAGAGTGNTAVVAERTFGTDVAAIGVVRPQIGAEVRVGSRVSGRVQRLRANIGDRVETGAVIAELETAELDALVAQRGAQLDLAEARVREQATMLPHELERAETERARWDATATAAAAEWARHRQLLERGVSTRAEAEAAQERHLVAQSQLEAARKTLELLRTAGPEQRRQAEAERDRAKAELTAAQVERSYTVIRAPIPGVVATVSTQEGETVAAGLSAPTFVTIVDLERLQVDAYVDEVDIGRIRVGQHVVFTVDAFPAVDFAGRVAALYPTATVQDNVVKYIAAVAIEGDHAGRLRPEMTASVRIAIETRTGLGIPVRAAQREGGRDIVRVVHDGRVETREVRLGWRDGAWIEVLEGLAAGEEVVLDAPEGGGTP